MMKFIQAILALGLIASVSFADTFSKPKKINIKNGEKVYNAQCASCHGPKGMTPWEEEIIPPLNGQNADYMVIQLQAFADDRPKHSRSEGNAGMMVPFAKNLSTQDMWDVSTYLNKVKERRKMPKEWYEKNKKDIEWAIVYMNTCKACHGEYRAGRFKSAPKLAGLPAGYLKEQMHGYSKGTRKGGQSTQMKLAADLFPEKKLEKLYLMIQSQEDKK